MQNYKLQVMYNGKNYSGWQIQDGKSTIEGCLTRAIKDFSGQDVVVVGSGRTDAGVSAFAQVANVKLQKQMPEQKLMHAINSHLPADIRVTGVQKVDGNFNARFSAKVKTYHYYFYTSLVNQPLLDAFALKTRQNLDIKSIKKACKYLVGTKNFKSFVAARSGKTNFERTITSAKIQKVGKNLYRLSISGTGFLYNMVRIIMGTLIMVGEGKRTPADFKAIIAAQDRTKAGKTVPPTGLILYNVKY